MAKQWSGYTLVEIVVAVSIFLILFIAAFIYMGGPSNKELIEDDTLSVASTLREARNAAFNGIIEPGGSDYPSGGYGVYLDPNVDDDTLIFYADTNDDDTYDTGEELRQLFLHSKSDFELPFSGGATSVLFDKKMSPIMCNAAATDCDPGLGNKLLYIVLDGNSSGDSLCMGKIELSEAAVTEQPLYIKTTIENCD